MANGNKALIAMSGGVDSSVAAHLTQERGFECAGATMLLHGEEDVEDARGVANRLHIPFHTVDFRDRFNECVVNRFIESYLQGRTPNPCIECNRFLKFGKLFEFASEIGADYVVSGHYATVEFDEALARFVLRKGKDECKDQSYVLYSLTQDQLSRLMLPLGQFSKDEVRTLAEQLGFANAGKPESQDICFVPDGDHAAFIQRRIGKSLEHGYFVDKEGKVLGEHQGIAHYTIGQRKGLGVSAGHPLYVCEIRPEDNAIVLGQHEDLAVRNITAVDINLIAVDRIEEPLRASAKIRYRSKEQPCTVTQPSPDKLILEFDEPVYGAACGQAAVVYQGDMVIGGGKIDACE